MPPQDYAVKIWLICMSHLVWLIPLGMRARLQTRLHWVKFSIGVVVLLPRLEKSSKANWLFTFENIDNFLSTSTTSSISTCNSKYQLYKSKPILKKFTLHISLTNFHRNYWNSHFQGNLPSPTSSGVFAFSYSYFGR